MEVGRTERLSSRSRLLQSFVMESWTFQVDTKHGPLWARVWGLSNGYEAAVDSVRHPGIRVARSSHREGVAGSKEEALQRLVRDINAADDLGSPTLEVDAG